MRSEYFHALEKVLDEQFPKLECQERGAALVLFAEANILHEQTLKALEEALPPIQTSPNELRAEIAHNKVERGRMYFNRGFNEALVKVRSLIQKLK